MVGVEDPRGKPTEISLQFSATPYEQSTPLSATGGAEGGLMADTPPLRSAWDTRALSCWLAELPRLV